MEKTRNQYVDTLRGVAILLVVLGHTMTGCTNDAKESFLYNIIWSLQMPLFVLISGYVTRYGSRIESGKELWKYMERRTLSYVLPWFVWSVLVRGVLFSEHNYLNIEWLLWHMDSGYWFLITIWTISLIFGVSSFFSKKIIKQSSIKRQAVLLGFYLLGMAILGLVGLLWGGSFFAIKLTIYYMPFFFVGFLYGQYQEKIQAIKWNKSVVDLIVAICLIGWLFILSCRNLYSMEDTPVNILIRAIASLAGCVAVSKLCKALLEKAVYIPEKVKNQENHLENDIPNKSCLFGDCSPHDETFCKSSGEFIENITISNCNHGEEQDTEIKQNTNHVESPSHIKKVVHWCGQYSLEIYLSHYLLLNLVKMEDIPIVNSFKGTILIILNFLVTILLTVILIKMVSSNKILRTVLFGKREK